MRKAGLYTDRAVLLRLETAADPRSGAVTRRWAEVREVRCYRKRAMARAVIRGPEGFAEVDAYYHVPKAHRVGIGWRLRDRAGQLYDIVNIEPDRAGMYDLCECTLVNE